MRSLHGFGFALAALLGPGAGLLVFGCASGNSGSAGPSGASTSASGVQAQAKALAQYQSGSSVSDAQNFSGTGSSFQSSSTLFALPLFDSVFTPTSSCVSLSITIAAGTESIARTFNCPNVTGTIDTQKTTSSSGSSYEVTTDVTVVDLLGDTQTTNAASAVSRASSGDISIAKSFNDEFTDVLGDTYQAQGSSTELFTPASPTAPAGTGSLVIASSVQYSQDGAPIGAFTVASSGLQVSSCGLSAGTITFQSAANTYVLTINACGSRTLTDNGAPVSMTPLNPVGPSSASGGSAAGGNSWGSWSVWRDGFGLFSL